jgi:hypothetical protein
MRAWGRKPPTPKALALEEILKHVSEDSLVRQSGWSPADAKSKSALTHEEFAAKMREWIENGAAIPE